MRRSFSWLVRVFPLASRQHLVMSNSPANSFSAPEWLDHLNLALPAYEFNSFVAQGTLGAVFKARQRSLDRDVAIKILSMNLRGNETLRQSFEAEARAMARLNHPNLIGVYDSGEVDGMPYIVMEYVPGKSLAHSAAGKRVAQGEAVRIIRAICLGLAHAHENGVIHRDIKPANILLTAKAEPKIGDFGLALRQGWKASGTAVGASGYTAPEVVEHPESADRRADLFAVGVILYELVSGKRVDAKQPVPEDLRDCPAGLQPICRRAIQPNPQLRYPDAFAMASALEVWQRQQPASAALPRSSKAPAIGTPVPVAAPPPPPATGQNPAPSGVPAKRPERSLAPLPPPTAAERTGLHDNWYLLIRILLLAAIIGSIPFTYKAIVRFRDQREQENERREEAASRKEKHTAAKPDKPSNPHPTPPPAKPAATHPATTAPKWEPPLEALARLRNHLKSGKRDEFPFGTIQHGGCHYLLVNQPMTWLEAAGFSEDHGAHLSIPADADDLRWIADQTGDAEWTWLGLGKNPSGQWLFVDGKSWNFGTPPLGGDVFTTINHFGVLKTAGAGRRLPFLIQWHDDGKNPATFVNVCQRLLHAGPQPVWPPGTVTHKSRHYYLVLRPMRWDNANGYAQKVGGKLAVAADADEALWLKSLITASACEDALWTAGRFDKNTWAWSTNAAWKPSGWFASASTPDVGSYLLLDSVRGWTVGPPDSAPRGFLIEWSDQHSDISSPPPPLAHENVPPETPKAPASVPAAPFPEEALTLEPRAKQLIASLAKERDDQLVANAKQFGWDIDVWVRSLSRAEQSVWQSEAAALKLLVRDKYVPEGIPQSSGIRLSLQMAKVATFCANKQKAIEADFLAKTKKIQDAYLTKVIALANAESSQGHEDNERRLRDMVSAASDLESWVESFGYPLRPARKTERY